ncbi:MAG: AAA family ATPase [Candidatus Marinimicrobia bacterium]|nr:AAA family ATPase [Candidatus Neomarinimicrobiota bacterium]
MIWDEYHRFLQTLDIEPVSADVRKIANLVLNNLDALIPLSTAQGQRVKKIVELAQANWDTLSNDILPIVEETTEEADTVSRLCKLTVGPFRGFARQEVFDLNSKLVLVYGPNGTGKTSFCEALEYGLLGNVAEAESRRFRDQREYLKYAHGGSFEEPILLGLNENDEVVPVRVNEVLYRFGFIEKNRIESFSRIAAQTPARQTELISTLFGLESFNEFVHNFTTEIDSRYIDLEGINTKLLIEKRQALAGTKEQLKSNGEELKRIEVDEQALSTKYAEGKSFVQMVADLNGDTENPGLIQRVEAELQQPIAAKSNLTASALNSLELTMQANLKELTEKQQDLASSSQEVSFKHLFEAVTQLRSSSPEYCPACKTPLSQVMVNPYAYADEELAKLQHLAILEQVIQQLNTKIHQTLIEVSRLVAICCQYFPTSNPLIDFQVSEGTIANLEWWNTLYEPLEDTSTPWQNLEVQVKQLEEMDKGIEQTQLQRTTKQTELSRLREFSNEILRLQTRRTTVEAAITAANLAIDTFDTENAQLIADAESEKASVVKNWLIASAYANFVDQLNQYKNCLPANLVTDLGESVVTLYNAFNRNDAEIEKLAAVRLPLEQNQRLEISYTGGPEVFLDALHILSEGHIRCIGLAILLAKNLKVGCPFIIFDDPVNAIDGDHKEGIRKSLFEDNYFADKQIILTSHGEEFFKDIQNLLTADQVTQSRTLAFLPKLGEQHVRVDFNCAPRNYIVSARAHFDRNEIRDALGKSRQALESLTKNKMWPYVNRYGDGNLSIKMRSSKSEIELRNLTEQLKSKIDKAEFTDPDKNRVLAPTEALLGLNGDSREWRYLNKGTHDETDRAEFDRHTVGGMLTYLEQIDAALG